MKIIEAELGRRVLIKLDFIKLFEAHTLAEFTIAPETGGMRVTWAMCGPEPFMLKLMNSVFNAKEMLARC